MTSDGGFPLLAGNGEGSGGLRVDTWGGGYNMIPPCGGRYFIL